MPPGISCNGRPARRFKSAWRCREFAPPRPAVANDPEYRKWIDQEPVRKQWQAALDVLATKGSSEVGYPIVANPESRDFIGQAVQDLILKQKTVDQACADADKGLDALIVQK